MTAPPEREDRLAKRRGLEEAGHEAHALRFDRTALAADLHMRWADLEAGAAAGETAAVAGRVMLRRAQGRLAFVVIEDPSGRIQLFCSQGDMTPDGWQVLDAVDIGDWVGATGEVVRTRKGELSVRPAALVMLSKALRPLPDKWHGLADVEARYRQRYLDLAVNDDARQLMRLRSRAVAAFRDELAGRGFLEVETPVLQPIYGGATAKPFVTHFNALDMDVYLRIAPELYLKRLLVGGVERVFEIARNFRNEGLGTKYNPEFTMLEAYQAFADYHDMAALVEDLCAAAGATGRLAPPWRRVRLADLVTEAAGVEMSLDVPEDELRRRATGKGVPLEPSWGAGKILLEAYEKLVEHEITDPTFVMDFPRSESPLTRAHREDERYAEKWDLVIDGVERCTGYSELADPLEQRRLLEREGAMRAAGDEEAMTVDEDFLRALEHGMPPAGGIGLGIDRIVMALAGVDTIREVVLFPLLRPAPLAE
jgi:lysyl-tRNA synthetase class 2